MGVHLGTAEQSAAVVKGAKSVIVGRGVRATIQNQIRAWLISPGNAVSRLWARKGASLSVG